MPLDMSISKSAYAAYTTACYYEKRPAAGWDDLTLAEQDKWISIASEARSGFREHGNTSLHSHADPGFNGRARDDCAHPLCLLNSHGRGYYVYPLVYEDDTEHGRPRIPV